MSTTPVTLADEIYQRVRHFPDDSARQVLDFVTFLELKLEMGRTLSSQPPAHQSAAFSRVQENADDPVWNDLLFQQPH